MRQKGERAAAKNQKRTKQVKDGWLPLKRDSKSCIKDGRLYLFKPSVFPFSRGDGQPFNAPKESGAFEQGGSKHGTLDLKTLQQQRREREREKQGIGLWRGLATAKGTSLCSISGLSNGTFNEE